MNENNTTSQGCTYWIWLKYRIRTENNQTIPFKKNKEFCCRGVVQILSTKVMSLPRRFDSVHSSILRLSSGLKCFSQSPVSPFEFSKKQITRCIKKKIWFYFGDLIGAAPLFPYLFAWIGHFRWRSPLFFPPPCSRPSSLTDFQRSGAEWVFPADPRWGIYPEIWPLFQSRLVNPASPNQPVIYTKSRRHHHLFFLNAGLANLFQILVEEKEDIFVGLCTVPCAQNLSKVRGIKDCAITEQYFTCKTR